MLPKEGFLMSPDTAMLFYQLCDEFNLTTMEQRKQLLGTMIKEKKVKYIRDVAKILAGKTAVHIKMPKGKKNG